MPFDFLLWSLKWPIILDKFGDSEEIDREDLKEEMKAYKKEFSVENDEVWDIIVDKVLAQLNNNKTQHKKSSVTN